MEGADEVSVRFASGERERAEIVGEDPSTDVAVVKVSAPEETLVPLTLERRSYIQVMPVTATK